MQPTCDEARRGLGSFSSAALAWQEGSVLRSCVPGAGFPISCVAFLTYAAFSRLCAAASTSSPPGPDASYWETTGCVAATRGACSLDLGAGDTIEGHRARLVLLWAATSAEVVDTAGDAAGGTNASTTSPRTSPTSPRMDVFIPKLRVSALKFVQYQNTRMILLSL